MTHAFPRLADNDNLVHQPTSTPAPTANSRLLASLRQTITRLERDGTSAETDLEPPEVPAADGTSITAAEGRHIALPHGWVHELWAKAPMDMQAATSLMLAAHEASPDRPFLWITSRALIREHGLPYGPGLLGLGIDPARILLVRCEKQQDALWALEECLKSSALAGVVGELDHIDLTASRRLTLVAREHRTRCLLLLRTPNAPSTAAYSRWLTRMAESGDNLLDSKAPGAGRLGATLMKHRGGARPQTSVMEWSHATDSVSLAATVADRPVAPVPSPVSSPVRQQGQCAAG